MKAEAQRVKLRVSSEIRIRIPEVLTSNPVLFLRHHKRFPIHIQFPTLAEIRMFLETFKKPDS